MVKLHTDKRLVYSTLAKGGKITIQLDDINSHKFEKVMANLKDKPLVVDINVDAEEQLEKMKRISGEQRKKIFALLNAIALEHYGVEKGELIRPEMQNEFLAASHWDDISLKDCPKEEADEFIEFLIEWAFENGIELKEHPKDMLDDIEKYSIICLRKKVCAICGKPGEVHHVDSIGQGRDRQHYDDSEHRKICLCRQHHSETHNIGWQTFSQKYHVKGVIHND